MTQLDWTEWKTGTIDPKIMINSDVNFESRRILGQWEYRIGTVRPPVIDHIHIYSTDLQTWTLELETGQRWNVIIETADGVPNGNVVICALA